MTLSKSLYTRGIQCSKSLWLKKYSSEVLTPPDVTTLARFETGNIVGDLACALFPNGREIPYIEKNFVIIIFHSFRKSYAQGFLISHETEIKEMFERVVEL